MTPSEILAWIGIFLMCGFLGYGLGSMVSEIKEIKSLISGKRTRGKRR